jgi:dTDP-4-dehydrorhamnose reductase
MNNWGEKKLFNIIVFGASGMAGHTISLYLHEKGHNVTSLGRTNPNLPFNHISIDIFDYNKLVNFIDLGNYNYIINCLGILNSQADELIKDASYINSFFPHFLELITFKSNIRVIHLSTDCVFSGKKGGYLENDFKDGSSFYDLSKSIGEINNQKDITFRNSIIGPDLKNNGIGLMNWFLKQDKQVNGYKNAFWSGVTTLELAKAINFYMFNPISGVYHLVNNRKISKFDLLFLLKNEFKKSIEILPSFNFISDKSLINTRIDFGFKVSDYPTMVKDLHDWILDHLYLYQHYNIYEV